MKKLYDEKLVEEYGFEVLPVAEDKKATNAGWPDKVWNSSLLDWDYNNPTKYGINLRDLVVVDLDRKDAIAKLPEGAVDTLVVETPRGYHLYFWSNDDKYLKQRIGLYDKIDIKAGHGKYVIGPGSPGYSIVNYADIAKLPDHFMSWIDNAKAIKKDTTVEVKEEKIPEGKRNDTLFKIACNMVEMDSSLNGTIGYLMGVNADVCDPPLGQQEIENIAKSAYNRLKNKVKVDVGISWVSNIDYTYTPNGLDMLQMAKAWNPPEVIVEHRDVPIFFDKTRVVLNGKRSSRKGLFALHIAQKYLELKRPVLWIDAENHFGPVFHRKISHGWNEDLYCHFNYRQAEALTDKHIKGFRAWMREYDETGLVILDSMTALGMIGEAANDAKGVTEMMAKYIDPWNEEGHATLALSHVAKNQTDETDASSYGSMAVESNSDVVMLLTNRGNYSEIRQKKDRMNLWEGKSEELVCLKSFVGHSLLCDWIDYHKEKKEVSEITMAKKIVDFFEENDNEWVGSKTSAQKEVVGNTDDKGKAWNKLEEEGFIKKVLFDGLVGYKLVRPEKGDK